MGRRADERDPESVPVTDASTRRLLTGRRTVVVGLVCVILFGVVFVVLQLARLGDPGNHPDGLPIDNRTRRVLLVYGVVRKGGTSSEVTDVVLRAEVPPGAFVVTDMVCGKSEIVAGTEGGIEVARRVSTECDEGPWTIEEGS